MRRPHDDVVLEDYEDNPILKMLSQNKEAKRLKVYATRTTGEGGRHRTLKRRN